MFVPARILVCAGALWGAGAAQAAWTYSVQFLGSTAATQSFEEAISSNLFAAMDLWTRHLAGGAAIELEVEFSDSVQRAAGYSLASGFVRRDGATDVYEQGLAYEIRTGIDPSGPAPDVRIQIANDYLVNELWFDPAPALRLAAVPVGRTDAVSLLAHELGHALAFNGWWDLAQGVQPAGYGSSWDMNTWFDGSALFFTGPSAMSLHGGPVPVTQGNNWHVGNATGAGADLLDDLMNGVSFSRGTRYDVSALDLAMLSDMGLVLAPVPEPSTAALLALGLAGLAAAGRQRQRRAECRARRPPSLRH